MYIVKFGVYRPTPKSCKIYIDLVVIIIFIDFKDSLGPKKTLLANYIVILDSDNQEKTKVLDVTYNKLKEILTMLLEG